MGGKGEGDIKKRVQEKVISAAHQEYNNKEILSDVFDKIKEGQDIFGRDAEFVMCTIDDSYPAYIREHQRELQHLIMKQETQEDRRKRRFKRKVRKIKEKGIRGIKKIGLILINRR